MSDHGKTALYALFAIVGILVGAATGLQDPASPCYSQHSC